MIKTMNYNEFVKRYGDFTLLGISDILLGVINGTDYDDLHKIIVESNYDVNSGRYAAGIRTFKIDFKTLCVAHNTSEYKEGALFHSIDRIWWSTPVENPKVTRLLIHYGASLFNVHKIPQDVLRLVSIYRWEALRGRIKLIILLKRYIRQRLEQMWNPSSKSKVYYRLERNFNNFKHNYE